MSIKKTIVVIKSIYIARMEVSLNSKFILLHDKTDIKCPALHVLNCQEKKYKSVLKVGAAAFGK